MNLHLIEISPIRKLKYFNPPINAPSPIGGIKLANNGKTTIVSDKEGKIYFVEYNLD